MKAYRRYIKYHTSQVLRFHIQAFLKADYQVSVEGIAVVNKMMDSGIFDATTYDLMKVYLKDEEEDMYWSEQQLDLCKMIGKQNYLTQLLINDQALTE